MQIEKTVVHRFQREREGEMSVALAQRKKPQVQDSRFPRPGL